MNMMCVLVVFEEKNVFWCSIACMSSGFFFLKSAILFYSSYNIIYYLSFHQN